MIINNKYSAAFGSRSVARSALGRRSLEPEKLGRYSDVEYSSPQLLAATCSVLTNLRSTVIRHNDLRLSDLIALAHFVLPAYHPFGGL